MPSPSTVRPWQMPDLCARCCALNPTNTLEVFSQPERYYGAVPSQVDAAKRRGMTAHVRQANAAGLIGSAIGMWDVSYSLAVPVCTGCEWQIEAGHSNAVWVAIGVGVGVAIGVGVVAVYTTGLTLPHSSLRSSADCCRPASPTSCGDCGAVG